jgi:hypothetical protein
MIHEMITSLPPNEVLQRAKSFFAERVPQYGIFLERESSTHASCRGQGGEEIALAVLQNPQGARVRASSLLFDQAIGRFFTTLPAAAGERDSA